MGRSLYDLLPDAVKQQYPPESLDAPAAKVLLRPDRVPDDYDPGRATEVGAMLAQVVPKMTAGRAFTNRVLSAQRGEPPAGAGSRGAGGGADWGTEPAPEEPTRTSFGRPLNPVGRLTTSEMYQGLTPTGRALARMAASAVQAAPNVSVALPPERQYSTRDLVPPPTNAAEHIADLVGGIVGFGATATAAGAVPGVGPAAAAGLTGFAQEGTLKERAIRGATLEATAGLTHGASTALAGPEAGALRTAAAQVPSAVGFGALQPWADRQIHALTGEKPEPFTGWDAAKGSLEMLAVNLLLGGRGIARAATRQRAAGPAAAPQAVPGAIPPGAAPLEPRTPEGEPAGIPDPVMRRARFIADQLQPPAGMSARHVTESRKITDAVNGVLEGKVVGLTLPESGGKVPARILKAVAYRTEAGTEGRLIVEDPAGSPTVVRYGSIDEMVRAIRPLSGRRGEGTRETVAAVRSAADEARLAEVETSLAGLQKSRPAANDKGYRRWAQRVARLTAERDALRGSPPESPAPSPAPTAPPAGTPTASPDADLDLFSQPPEAPPAEPARAQRGPVASPERAQGTAPPAAQELKPLEQATLEGMPKPAIPGGAKRAAFDESADVVKTMGEEPEPAPPTLFDQPRAETSVEEPTGARGYKAGERVRVPYTGRSTAFGRKVTKATEVGSVVGYEPGGRVTVDVERGKGVVRQTFSENAISRLPTNESRKAAAAKREAKGARLDADLEARIGGNPAKATAIIREYEQKAAEAKAAAPELGQSGYEQARNAYKAALEVVARANAIRQNILTPPGGFGEGEATPAPRATLDETVRARLPEAAWNRSLTTAAEDFPEHFTPQRQTAIADRATQGSIANSTEMEAAVEHERALVEAGVPSDAAARAADATDRIRRAIWHEENNPLYDPRERQAAVGWMKDLLAPDRLSTPEKLASALAEFDKRVPPSPANDVPMGQTPDPFGWGEEGFATPESLRALAGGMWLDVLRAIPRRLAAAWRNVPRSQRPAIADRGGNRLLRMDNHGEWDHFSHSMYTRFLAVLSGARLLSKERILTPDREKDLVSASPAVIGYQGRWRQWFLDAWGPLIGEAPMFSSAQRDVARVMSGAATPEALPPRFRSVPDRLEAVYQRIRADINATRADFGLEPMLSVGVRRVQHDPTRFVVRGDVRINMPEGTYTDTGIRLPDGARIIVTDGREVVTRYGGPHLMFDNAASSLEATMEAIFGEQAKDSETIPEMTSRFLNRRQGKTSQIEDAAHNFEAYISSLSRYAAHLPFFKGVEAELKDMDATGNGKRAELTRAWLRMQFAGRDDPVTQFITNGLNALTFERNPNTAQELSRPSAEHMAKRIGAATLGKGVSFWRVPQGAELVKRGDVRVVGTGPHGARLVATDGASPIEGTQPKARAWVRRKLIAGAVREAKGAARKGQVPFGMTEKEYRRSLMRRDQATLTALSVGSGRSVFRGIRYMQHLALLGYNLGASLANLSQPLMTLGPEIGYFNLRSGMTGAVPAMARQFAGGTRRLAGLTTSHLTDVLGALRLMSPEAAIRWKRRLPVADTGSLASRRLGLLSGETQRLSHEQAVGEVAPRRDLFLRSYLEVTKGLGPMAPFSLAEDFTRGAALLSAIGEARRLGLPSSVADRVVEPGTPEYAENLLAAAKAIRTPGTAERYAAHVNSATMYDYNRFGRAPIFNSPLGGLVGLLTTFPSQFATRVMFRAPGAVAKLGTAAIRRATGGPVTPNPGPRAMFPGGPEFVPVGGDTWAQTPLGRWLREGGASGYDVHGGGIFLRASLFAGVVVGATVATGVNFALAGTPGWDRIVLGLMARFWPNDPDVKKALAVSQRSAAIDPARGIPLSPTLRAVVKSVAEPAMTGRNVEELGQAMIPLKVALGRYLQNRPDAARLREGGDLHWLAIALGIHSVTPSRTATEEAMRNLRLQAPAKAGENRENVRKPKRRSGSAGPIGYVPEPARATG